jgi:hypothetical protein
MTLYSVIPTEVIFHGMEQYNPHYEDIELHGVSMQVERISYNEARIVRLYSVNPQDFLKPELCPGTLIVYGPSTVSS